ncbi:MAG: TIGR00180 family glycosyltransferase [Chloroflexi bacterium]|nr:TIGR00180 family glycosyltransferase [Chloroflexota bacterium]
MASEPKITICIPTKNRADFLRRLLQYFAGANCQHRIYIADSSDGGHLDETKKTVGSLGGRLSIRHFECPGLSVVAALDHVNQFIATPYAAVCADDDFLAVNGVDRCVHFLENNPDFGAAHGIGILTYADRPGPRGNIGWAGHYRQAVTDAGSGSRRLQDYFAGGPLALLFSVHRAQDWRDIYRETVAQPWARQGFSFDELVTSSISVIRGKVKELDCLYLVRFGHDRINPQVHGYDWFTSPDWFAGFEALRTRAVAELMRKDGIGKEQAEEAFKQAIVPYLARMFSRGLPAPRPGVFARLKRIAARIPGVIPAHELMGSPFSAKEEKNLLPSFLKPSSPYHEDFMPIYRAITTPQPEPGKPEVAKV